MDGARMPRALASVLEVISDEAMDRAVQVGLARSEDDTWRMVERCLAPARALARAREDLRAEPRHAHPFYWAPFVFFDAD
jgi:hypothetical protein